MEDIMDKVKQEAKRIWKLAMANKKVTMGVVVVIVVLLTLISN